MSSNYASMFLSKVVDTENVHAFQKHNITEGSFVSEIDRKVYEFITDYADHNRGQTPSYATVISEIPDFDYIPGVTDGYEYLASKVRQRRAQVDFRNLMMDEVPRLYEDVGQDDMGELTSVLTEKVDEIKLKLRTGVRIGTNLKTDIADYEEEYRRRQMGESFRVWNSFLPFITNSTGGGYASGNIYTVYGKSGRGKSVFVLYEAAYQAMQGANVLVWSMEMSAYGTITRLYTFISAMVGITEATVDGKTYEAGFDANQLRNGSLEGEVESEFFRMLKEINHHIKGNLTVRAVDDEDFTARNLNQLKADITELEADIVVIDPFYYLDYEVNTSKTAGGDAAETSKKLRRLAGQTSTVVFAITQAEETDEKENDDESREIKLPERKHVKKTTQLLEDAALLIAVDTDYTQKLGRVGLRKGRNGGEGSSAEIVYIPSVGVVKEVEIDADMFGF